MFAVSRVVLCSCALVAFVLLLDSWMARFFGLPRPLFRPGRMDRPTPEATAAVVVALPRPAEIWRRPKAQGLLGVLCATAVLLLATTAPAQSTLAVTDSSDNLSSPAAGSLRKALSMAAAGDTINIAVTGTITLAGPLPAIGEDLTITGPGAKQLTISGASLYPVFIINAGTVGISGLTIAKGNSSSNGGAILNSGTLTVSASTFTGNTTSAFGGAIASAGTLTVSESSFAGNSSNFGGGIFSTGTLTVSGSSFVGNPAFSSSDGLGYGGAIASATQTTLSNNTFSGNSGTEGGAIYNQAGLTVSNNTFSGNTTSGFGGAIYDKTTGSGSTVNNNIFIGNSALLGAGVANGGTTNASYNVFYNNLSGGSESDCYNCTSNSDATDANPQLAPLGNYGSTTQTMLPLPGSRRSAQVLHPGSRRRNHRPARFSFGGRLCGCGGCADELPAGEHDGR
jgi:parallel beta-helix repeat protein/predicted outer membrane repeat protein